MLKKGLLIINKLWKIHEAKTYKRCYDYASTSNSLVQRGWQPFYQPALTDWLTKTKSLIPEYEKVFQDEILVLEKADQQRRFLITSEYIP
jgi:hypothetical protein